MKGNRKVREVCILKMAMRRRKRRLKAIESKKRGWRKRGRRGDT